MDIEYSAEERLAIEQELVRAEQGAEDRHIFQSCLTILWLTGLLFVAGHFLIKFW